MRQKDEQDWHDLRYGRRPRGPGMGDFGASPSDRLPARQRLHDALIARFAEDGTAWLTSTRGSEVIRFDATPHSAMPDVLRDHGYTLIEEPTGERALGNAVVERFSRRKDGGLDLLAPGSTATPDEVRRYAGIIKTRRYRFSCD